MEGFKRGQQQQQQAETLPASCAKEALVAVDNSLLFKYVASLPFTIPEELPAGVPATALPLHQHFRQVQLQWLASQGQQSPAAPAVPQAGPVPALPQLGPLGPTDERTVFVPVEDAADKEAEKSTANERGCLAAADVALGNAMQHSSSIGRLMPATLRETSPAKLDKLEKFAWALVAELQRRADHIMPMAEVKAWAMSMEPLLQYSPMNILKSVKAELSRSGVIKYQQLKGRDGKNWTGMRLVLDPCQAVLGPSSALTPAGQGVAGGSCVIQVAEQQAQQEPSPEQADQGHNVGGEEADEDEAWLSMVDLKLRPQQGRQLSLPLPPHVSRASRFVVLAEAGTKAQVPASPKERCMQAIGRVQSRKLLKAVSGSMPLEAALAADAHPLRDKPLAAKISAGLQVIDGRGRPALGNANSQQPGFVPSGAGSSRNKRATVDTPADGCRELQRPNKKGRLLPANHAAASKSSGLASKDSGGRNLLAEGAADLDKDLKRAHAAQQRRSQHQPTLGSGRLGMQTHLAKPAAGSSKQHQRSTQPPPCQGKQHQQAQSLVGRHMLVFWPKYDAWYEGIVTSSDGRMHEVEYLDGDVGRIDMEKDRIVFLP
ncbi:hypothetical protein N2152v2_000874 [Parachlorella kessleri]